MADEADIAQEYERRLADDAIARAKAALQPVAKDADCIGCGEEIEAERRKAMPSARRCIACERRRERSRVLFRRTKWKGA